MPSVIGTDDEVPSPRGWGVRGSSDRNYGVLGISNSGLGVTGRAATGLVCMARARTPLVWLAWRQELWCSWLQQDNSYGVRGYSSNS